MFGELTRCIWIWHFNYSSGSSGDSPSFDTKCIKPTMAEPQDDGVEGFSNQWDSLSNYN